jgi:hypothetical protein
MGNKNFHDVKIEPKVNVALNIHENRHVLLYLQINEILIGLALEKFDYVVHKAKQSKWERLSKHMRIVPCPKQHEDLVWHVHEKLGHFEICVRHNINDKDAIICSIICLSICWVT